MYVQVASTHFVHALVLAGYFACLALVSGAMLCAIADSVLVGETAQRIVHLDDALRSSSNGAVLIFGAAHAILFVVALTVSLPFTSRSLLCAIYVNTLAFYAMLSFAGREWSFAFVLMAGLARITMHAIVSTSHIGFLWYRVISTLNAAVFVAHIVLWGLTRGEYAGKHELHIAAFSVEFFLWAFVAFEYACLVSVLHGSEYTTPDAQTLDFVIHMRKDRRVFRRLLHADDGAAP